MVDSFAFTCANKTGLLGFFGFIPFPLTTRGWGKEARAMKNHVKSILVKYVASLFIVACALGQSISSIETPPYSAALLDGRELHIFPFNGAERTLPLPVTLTQIAYDVKGVAIYGFDRHKRGISKVNLESFSVELVPNTESFRSVTAMAPMHLQNRILVAGISGIGNSQICGLFTVSIPDGSVKSVIHSAECGTPSAWRNVEASPDGNRATIFSRDELELIDLNHGEIRSLGTDFSAAAWSPNGKWLAAVQSKGEHNTLVFNAQTLERERTLGRSSAKWSPDSRYILAWAQHDLCGPDWGTLEAIALENGRKMAIGSSKCKVNLNSIGWVTVSNPR